MLNRCILIFPELKNINIIHEIRKKYDPVVHHVGPHITLVFPFKSDITSARLKEHLDTVLFSFKPFKLALQGITPGARGNYLFLNITEGKDEIIAMHNKLYTGLLEPYKPQWLKQAVFYPHMTVGKVENEAEYRAAIAETKQTDATFHTIVHKISVEIIQDNQDSIIEMEVALGKA